MFQPLRYNQENKKIERPPTLNLTWTGTGLPVIDES